MLSAHTLNLLKRSLLQRAFQLFIVNCYSNRQMLRTLTNKSDDEAFVCWSNADGEELLDDDAE